MCRRRVKCTRGDLRGMEYRGGEGNSGIGVGFWAGWCGMWSLGCRLHGLEGEGGQDLSYRFMGRRKWHIYTVWRHLEFLSQSC